MKKKYDKVYEIVTSLKVLCALFAVVYMLLWFYCFFELPYYDLVTLFFAPVANLINIFITPSVEYADRTVDMTYLIISVFLYVLYFIFGKLSVVVDNAEKKYQLSVIEERKIQERLINEDLKEVFKNKTLKYNAFGILLTLNLKHMIDPNVNDINQTIKDTAMKQYVKIVSKMRKKYPTCKAITPDKLFIIYNNFALFDDFLIDILKEIKLISIENTANKISTNFTIAIDALKETDKVAKVLDLLEKISTFNYTNKAIATSGFNVRYNFNVNKKFTLETMGISRFFEKSEDGAKAQSVDFELFSIKSKTKRKTA